MQKHSDNVNHYGAVFEKTKEEYGQTDSCEDAGYLLPSGERSVDDESIITWDKNITPEQKALLREHNFREYPTIQELTAANIVENFKNTKLLKGKNVEMGPDVSESTETEAKDRGYTIYSGRKQKRQSDGEDFLMGISLTCLSPLRLGIVQTSWASPLAKLNF